MLNIKNEAIAFNMGYDMDTKAGQEISPEEIPEFKNIFMLEFDENDLFNQDYENTTTKGDNPDYTAIRDREHIGT